MAVTLNALTTGVGGLQTTGDSTGIIQLQTNGTATVTVDASGNVGIGTASPASKFEVAGLATFQKGGASGITIGDVSTNSGAVIRMQGTNATYNWQIDNNVSATGLGFTPSTIVGGTTYTTPVLVLTGAGAIGLGSPTNYGTSGQFLKSNGPGAAATWGTAGGGFSNMTVYTSPGTFTTPSTTTQIKVTVVGGGGGAGGPGAGSGGGGGGAAIYVGPVSASTGYTVTVGTGGGQAASGNTSSFGALASATGGSTGSGGNSNGGAGGAGSAGTLQFKGGCGQSCVYNGSGIPTGGGSSYLGGGGVGGGAGGNYGGGASGAASGAGGVVVVEY